MHRVLFAAVLLLLLSPLAAEARDPTPEMRARIEAALREQDDLQELLLREPDEAADLVPDLLRRRRDRRPAVVGALEQARSRRLARRAGAARLGPLVLGRALHAQHAGAELHVELVLGGLQASEQLIAEAIESGRVMTR